MFLFSCSAHAAWGRRTCMLSSVFVVLGKLRGTKGVCSLQSFLLSRRGCVHRLRDSVLVLAKASILPEFPPLRFWGANPHAGIFFSSRLKGSKLPGTYKRVPCRLNISQFMYVSGAKLIILIHEEGREKIWAMQKKLIFLLRVRTQYPTANSS